jgi:hypothetical protein
MKIYYITCALGNKIYFNPRASSTDGAGVFILKTPIQQRKEKDKFFIFELGSF